MWDSTRGKVPENNNLFRIFSSSIFLYFFQKIIPDVAAMEEFFIGREEMLTSREPMKRF